MINGSQRAFQRQPGDESEYDDIPGDIFNVFREDGETASSQGNGSARIVAGTEATPSLGIPSYTSFPVDLIPRPISTYTWEAAAAIGCDPAMVALPMLSSLSSAIGNALTVEVKPGSWFEPLNVWSAIIAESGTSKTAAVNSGTTFVDRWHDQGIKEYADAMLVYEAEQCRWETENSGKRKKSDPPNRPTAKRCQVGDATIEALTDILAQNPRGVQAKFDELSGLFKSFNQYKGRGGSDVASWLSMFRAEPLTIDRKVNQGVRYIPRAFVSITGGIQPGILRDCLTNEHIENGLASRFLFAQPPVSAKRWTDEEVDPRVDYDAGKVFKELFCIPCGERPGLLRFSPDARDLFRRFVDEHGQETHACDGPLRAAFSKLEGYTARFAGIFHAIRLADGKVQSDHHTITAASVADAIALTAWFRDETDRVYRGLSREQTELAELVKLIQTEFGGRVTARELARRKRKYRKAGEAEQALEFVRSMKAGDWRTITTNGRPATVLELHAVATEAP